MACGEWKLSQEIGRGAYGVVYMAIGHGGERAAVKVCRRDAVGDERYARELRGAKLYRSIPPQEGLVRMRELVEAEWGFYTVMDLADDEFGGPHEPSDGYRPKTLARVIEGEKALPLKECVMLALSLAKGLAALQRHHLLHRDIKPGNVLYVKGRPVLSDPGLIVEESNAASIVGTPGYVPPEKFTDAASDIYSLGLTLKAASFGRQVEELDKGPAMEAETSAALFPAWWRILNKATDPTPSRRYQSAKALLKDIKVLCLKMAVASKFGSRTAKAAILSASVVVVAFIGVLVVRNGRMSNEVSDQKEEIAKQRSEVSVQREEIDRQAKVMTGQREQIDRQDKEMTAQREYIDRQSKDMAAQREQIDRLNKEIASHREEVSRQKVTIRSQNKEIAGKLGEIARQRDEIAKQRSEIDKRAREMSRQAKEITGLMEEMVLQRELIAKQRSEIDKRAREVSKQAKEISGQIEAHALLTGNETNLVSELHSLRQFKTDTENLFKRAEQETLWDLFLRKDTGWTRGKIRTHTHNIAKIAAIDAAKASVFQERIDKLNTLVEKEEAFHRAIVEIRKVDEEKRRKGIHVTEEYEQAKKIYKEKVRFHNAEVKPLEKELDAICKRFEAENKNVQFEKISFEDLGDPLE